MHLLESSVWVVGYESWVWWQWDVLLGGGDDAEREVVSTGYLNSDELDAFLDGL